MQELGGRTSLTELTSFVDLLKSPPLIPTGERVQAKIGYFSSPKFPTAVLFDLGGGLAINCQGPG